MKHFTPVSWRAALYPAAGPGTIRVFTASARHARETNDRRGAAMRFEDMLTWVFLLMVLALVGTFVMGMLNSRVSRP